MMWVPKWSENFEMLLICDLLLPIKVLFLERYAGEIVCNKQCNHEISLFYKLITVQELHNNSIPNTKFCE